ncbi:MAG: Uma2 family endonuclease [Nitrococcus sp.]|nr:Uma2 family endonuclease [Nitrococcus sp.]
MVEALPKRMTVGEFLTWAERQPARYELHCGEVIAMSPERNRHGVVKLDTAIELRRAVAATGVGCRVFVDGVSLVVNDTTSYVPDVVVHCGPFDLDRMTVDQPVIVVEVQSPSSTSIDSSTKYFGYFSIESVVHYLILDPIQKRLAHHRRTGRGIESAIVTGGLLPLDPPGIEVDVAAFFASV